MYEMIGYLNGIPIKQPCDFDTSKKYVLTLEYDEESKIWFFNYKEVV